jgi:hypothetical protein
MDEEPSATGLPQEIGQPRDFELEPGSIPVGAIVEARSMGRACCRGACCFIFVGEYRASSCWYLCWYRQQSTIKVTLNSNGYGTKGLPARGTNFQAISAYLRTAKSSNVRFAPRAAICLATHNADGPRSDISF